MLNWVTRLGRTSQTLQHKLHLSPADFVFKIAEAKSRVVMVLSQGTAVQLREGSYAWPPCFRGCPPSQTERLCPCCEVSSAWGHCLPTLLGAAHLSDGVKAAMIHLRGTELWITVDRMDRGDLCPAHVQPFQSLRPCEGGKLLFSYRLLCGD